MEDISSNIKINNIISNNNNKPDKEFIQKLNSKIININEINIKKPDNTNNIEEKKDEMKQDLIEKERNGNNIDSKKAVNELKKKRKINHDENCLIRRIYKEFSDRNSLIKRTYSMPDLEHENLLEPKRKTVFRPTLNINDFIFKDNKKLINRESKYCLENIPEISEEFDERFSILNINKNIVQNIDDKVENKEEEKNDKLELPRSRSFKIEKEITSDYYEENEHKNKNIIIYKNTINKIKCISFNLLLKKIVFEDFLRKHASEIYHFCQQCFCFINTEIFFGKILNCYKYYRKKNVSYEKLENLIEFFNILIIEMFSYYKIIPKNEIQSIKHFYNEVISDLIINNNANSYDYIEMNFNREQFINLNLNFNENIMEENEQKANDEIYNKYKMAESLSGEIDEKNDNDIDNDYIVIEKDEDTYDENIYNEEKDLSDFINTLFLNDSFTITRNSLYIKSETISILTINEKILIKLKLFLNLFKSKRPNDGQISEAKNSILLYKLLNEEKNFQKYKNNNMKKSLINRTHCLTLNEKVHYDKNFSKRTYLLKGFFSLYDWKPEEIGEELIRVTKKLLNKIEKKELYKAVYLKKNKNITSPNVIENINNFNKLTFFIIEDIISYDNPSDRAKIMEKWAQVAEYCKSRRDFNDCIAIHSALNNYIITGLNLTNKELRYKGSNLIKSISNFCSCDGNYKNIREEIKKLINLKEYYYPYLGMMLRDITFFEESSKYLVNGNLINFEKIENIQNIIENNFRYREEEHKNEQKYIYIKELSFFEHLENNSEENLESIANKIEPKFELNDGKKEFKRKTTIDEKYFIHLNSNLLFRKSCTLINGFFPFSH